jgi:hypothetical protein
LEEAVNSRKQLQDLAKILRGYRFLGATENDLCLGISHALEAAGVWFLREVQCEGGRLDFLCGDVAIEVKIKGSLADLTRQVHGYLKDPTLAGLLIVTTRSAHRDLPSEISGKPVGVAWIRGIA